MSLNLGPNTMLPLLQLGSDASLINNANPPSVSRDVTTVVDFIKKYDGKGSRILTKKKVAEQFLIDLHESELKAGVDVEDSKQMLSASYRNAELFYSLEYIITDHILFWIIFGDQFVGSELNCQFENEIKTSLNRFGRLDYPLGQRVRWSNWIRVTFREMSLKLQNKVAGLSKIKKQELGKIVKFVRAHGDSDPITAYRGFVCRKELGHRIRKSDVKGDGDFWTQIEGAGTSYTLDPNVAATFATRRTDFTSFHHCLLGLAAGAKLKPDHLKFPDADLFLKERDSEDGKRNLQREYEEIMGMRVDEEARVADLKNVKIQPVVDAILTNADSKLIRLAADIMTATGRVSDSFGDEADDTYAGFGVRPVVGEYQFFKEDIITIFDYEGETEITVFPNDVSLQRYEFLSSKEIVARYIDATFKKTKAQ